MSVSLTELLVGDDAASWSAAGFHIEGDHTNIGTVTLRFAGTAQGRGILGWTLSGIDHDTAERGIEGVATSVASSEPVVNTQSVSHANGTVAFDHLVMISPDLGRTIAALESLGVVARRTRDVGTPDAPRQQVFFWMGEPILELVGSPHSTGDGPARLYGIALTVADIDATADTLGERVGRVKDAVQPGRRITTLRTRELDMSVPVAFMSAHVRTDSDA
jgi:hypothetical protein